MFVLIGYKDVVKILLTRGANPNRQDSLGNTPLHLAVCSASSYNFNMVRSIHSSILICFNSMLTLIFAVVDMVLGRENFIAEWCTC